MQNIWDSGLGKTIGQTDGRQTWDMNGRLLHTRFGDSIFENGTDRLLGRWYGNQFYGPTDKHLLSQHGSTTYNPQTWGKVNELY